MTIHKTPAQLGIGSDMILNIQHIADCQKNKNDPKILCNRAGKNLIISKGEFKNYERQ